MRRLIFIFGLLGALFAFAGRAFAQGDEIVANLAGGRVIIHVTRDGIVFGAIDQPLEAKSVPPRVAEMDLNHIGIFFGASEWQVPAAPKPIRLDRDIPRVFAAILIATARPEPEKAISSRLALATSKSCVRSSPSFTIRSTCSPTNRFSRSL